MEEAESPAPIPCVVSDPGHGPLPTTPCCRCWQQQEEHLEEEKAEKAPWVQAQGWKGHAQPEAVTRWLLEPATV